MAKTKKEREFEAILLEAIDEALLTLGKNVQLSIYFHLETKFGLPKQFIPDRISDFSNALEKIFGPASKKIEILIMKFLNEKVKCTYEWVGPKWLIPDITFEDYIKMVMFSLESGKTGLVEVTLNEGEKPEQKT
ncbi:MAG: hypothetical protein ACQCN4_12825 [Candidatus Bathyarchaeia archaeon]